MKTMFALSLMFTASAAMAHVEPGTWSGRTPTGAPCAMIAGETYFEGNVAHPLNERVKLTVNGDLYVVGHPPVLDVAQGAVAFNHDLFQAIRPTTAGARALVLTMVHSPNFEGPTEYKLIDHQWRSNVRAVVHCTNLKLNR